MRNQNFKQEVTCIGAVFCGDAALENWLDKRI
jgi:hypothetical protein